MRPWFWKTCAFREFSKVSPKVDGLAEKLRRWTGRQTKRRSLYAGNGHEVILLERLESRIVLTDFSGVWQGLNGFNLPFILTVSSAGITQVEFSLPGTSNRTQFGAPRPISSDGSFTIESHITAPGTVAFDITVHLDRTTGTGSGTLWARRNPSPPIPGQEYSTTWQVNLQGSPPPPPPTTGTIQGSAWNDVDGDGIRDASEMGISGRRMFLDINEDHLWQTGEPSQLTDGSGRYEFTLLAPSLYDVAQVLPDGWEQTSPSSPSSDSFRFLASTGGQGADQFSLVELGDAPNSQRLGPAGYSAGLDYDPVGGKLFGASTTFRRFDPVTGAMTELGALRTSTGTELFAVSLAFSPNGELYGLGLDDHDLYRMDINMRIGTRIGDSGRDFWGIDFAADGKLYGTTFGDLFELNPTTGAVTRTIGAFGTGVFINGEAEFAPDGQLYGVNSLDGTLFQINTATGRATNVGQYDARIVGVATVPNNGSPDAFGLALPRIVTVSAGQNITGIDFGSRRPEDHTAMISLDDLGQLQIRDMEGREDQLTVSFDMTAQEVVISESVNSLSTNIGRLVNEHVARVPLSAITSRALAIDLGAGNDSLKLSSLPVGLLAVTVSGGTGNDTVTGGASNEVLIGGDGNDSLKGGTGNDTLTGGAGNDTLDGGNGTDELQESGDANLKLTNSKLTGLGTDKLVSIQRVRLMDGGGDHKLDAASFTGAVTLSGGAGDDTLIGGSSNDSLAGGTGNDSLLGQAGKDTLFGGDGNDTLNGGVGDDAITGQDGNDSLLGGDGKDTIVGGTGNDTLKGGAGNDTLIGGFGVDVVTGERGTDKALGGQGSVVRGGTGSRDVDDTVTAELIDEAFATLFAFE